MFLQPSPALRAPPPKGEFISFPVAAYSPLERGGLLRRKSSARRGVLNNNILRLGQPSPPQAVPPAPGGEFISFPVASRHPSVGWGKFIGGGGIDTGSLYVSIHNPHNLLRHHAPATKRISRTRRWCR